MNDRYFLISITSVVATILSVMILLIMGGILPQRLPLFYSLAWGESRLTSLAYFFIIPTIIFCISLVNLLIAWQLHPSQHLFKQILIYSTLVSSLVLFISLIKIILIFL